MVAPREIAQITKEGLVKSIVIVQDHIDMVSEEKKEEVKHALAEAKRIVDMLGAKIPPPNKPTDVDDEEDQEQERSTESLFKQLKTELDNLLQKVSDERDFLQDLQKETLVTVRADQDIKTTLDAIALWKVRYAEDKKEFLKLISPGAPLRGDALKQFTSFFDATKKAVQKELDDLKSDLNLEAGVEQKEARTLARLLQTDAQIEQILGHIDILARGLREAVAASQNLDNPMVHHATELGEVLLPQLSNMRGKLQQEDAGIKAVAQAIETKREIEKQIKKVIGEMKEYLSKCKLEDDISGKDPLEKYIAHIHNASDMLVYDLQQQDGNLVQTVEELMQIIQTVLPVMAKVEQEAKAIQKEVLKDENWFNKLRTKFTPYRPFQEPAARNPFPHPIPNDQQTGEPKKKGIFRRLWEEE